MILFRREIDGVVEGRRDGAKEGADTSATLSKLPSNHPEPDDLAAHSWMMCESNIV